MPGQKSLLDEFREEQDSKFRGGGVCGVRQVAAAMNTGDRESFELAVADHALMGTTIVKVLANRGFTLSPKSIQRHRRGECTCWETASE